MTSQRSSSPSTTFPISSSEIERRTPPPCYTPPFWSTRDSLVSAPTYILQQLSLTEANTRANDNISRPYILRPNAPARRISARAVGRPSPILTRRLSRPKLAHVSSPLPLTRSPIKRRVALSPTQRPSESELPSKYTLELDLPDGQSRFISSLRMRGLVTNSYADLKPKRRVSRRKSNASLRSSASDRFKSAYSDNTYLSDNELPPVPTLPRHSDFDIQHSNTDATPPTSTSSMPPSTTTTDPSTPSLPQRAKESRYLRNPPPPLQLNASSHRPRSNSKRYSRRILRETHRASVQSLDSSTFPLSPFTPRPKMPSKKEQQRRRLLKLRRTLGEDFPLELLTPPPSSEPSATRMRDLASFRPGGTIANTSSNYLQPPISVATNPTPTLLATLPRTQKRGAFALGMRQKNNLLAPHTSATRPTPTALAPVRVSVDKAVSSELSPRAPSPPVILISAHPYSSTIPMSDSVSSSSEYSSPSSTYYLARGSTPPPSTQRDPPSDSSESRRSHWPRTPFAHAIKLAGAAGPTYLAPPPSFVGSAGIGTTSRRSERRQGWSGEWNQPDMQDVIAKLRNI